MTVPRVGARMILLDEDDRVLLVEEAGTDPGGDWHHWLTPGGGVERDEALTAAATREVVEEIGVRVVLAPDAEPWHTHRRAWTWRGVTYDQLDNYFAARVSRAFTPAPSGLTEMERETVLGARWWSVDELRVSSATFIPPHLDELVDAAIADPSVTRPVYRPAGRTFVLDRCGAVLLIDVRPDPESDYTNWITPGGGCEGDETAAQAAARELREEIGIVVDLASSEPVSVEHAVFPFGGRIYDQIDHFFVVSVDERPSIEPAGQSEVERAMVREYRWWTAAELRATYDIYWPRDLPDVLDRLAVVEQ